MVNPLAGFESFDVHNTYRRILFNDHVWIDIATVLSHPLKNTTHPVDNVIPTDAHNLNTYPSLPLGQVRIAPAVTMLAVLLEMGDNMRRDDPYNRLLRRDPAGVIAALTGLENELVTAGKESVGILFNSTKKIPKGLERNSSHPLLGGVGLRLCVIGGNTSSNEIELQSYGSNDEYTGVFSLRSEPLPHTPRHSINISVRSSNIIEVISNRPVPGDYIKVSEKVPVERGSTKSIGLGRFVAECCKKLF
jgi:hypothetical protein